MAEFTPSPLEFTVPFTDVAVVTKVIIDAVGRHWELGKMIERDRPGEPGYTETLAIFKFYTRMEWKFALEEVRKAFQDEIKAAYRSEHDNEAGNLDGVSSYWRYWYI